MFTNHEAAEIGLRVVFFGPPLAGKGTLLRAIWEAASADEKGKLVSVAVDDDRTLFFDLGRADFPEVDGRRLRLHLYALTGPVFYAASPELLLKGVDAVVFVADAQAARCEANIASFEQLDDHLRAQGRSLAALPHLLVVTKTDLDEIDPPEVVAANLGSAAALAVDGRTGRGIPELLERLVAETALALREGRLEEWCPSADEMRRNRESIARARLAGHYGAQFGEATDEYRVLGRDDDAIEIVILEHPPNADRSVWTYATAGLSLCSPPVGRPRTELLAYAEFQDPRVADVLALAAKQLDEWREPVEPSVLRLGHQFHEDFVLAPVPESASFRSFPDLSARTEDVCFTHAITGNVEDSVDLRFLQLVPVTDDELAFARADGVEALLAALDLPKRGRAFGWARGRDQSVLRRGFFARIFGR
jgi:signal recognition particle receptor subunit beta